MKDWQEEVHKIQNIAIISISFAPCSSLSQQSTLTLTTQSQNFSIKGYFDEQTVEAR